jgi:hypothetical protein
MYKLRRLACTLATLWVARPSGHLTGGYVARSRSPKIAPQTSHIPRTLSEIGIKEDKNGL